MTKRIVFGGIGIILIVVVVLRIVQASADVEVAPDVGEIRQAMGIPVEVAAAQVSPIVVQRQFTGTLRGIRSAEVRARTGDEIIEIAARVGQRVEEGAVLVRQSSEGSGAAVRQAEAAAEAARRTVERLRPLREQGALSDQDWDNAQTGLRVAEANLAAAQRAIVLTSPIAGIVTDVLVTEGSYPGSGDPLVRVSDLSRLQLTFQVSPGQARELAVGQPASLPDFGLAGRISRVALQTDPDTRLLEVEATFPGTSVRAGGPVPGSIVVAAVEVGRNDAALCVPVEALRSGEVWVVDADNVAHLRPVRIGLDGDELVEVLEGVVEGERVVTAGASLLSEGARVRVVGGTAASSEG